MSKLNLYAITGSLTDDIDPVTIIISADDQIAAENAFESELRVIRELDDEVDIFGAFRVADIAPDGSLVLAESLKPILPASEAGDLRLFSVTLDDEPLPTSRLVCLHDEAGLEIIYPEFKVLSIHEIGRISGGLLSLDMAGVLSPCVGQGA